MAVVIAAIVIASSAIYFYRSKNVDPPGGPSKVLAVLPFKPLVEQDSDQALEIGMADTLIARLSNISGLVLRPLSSVRKFSGSEKDPQSAGRELGVDSVLDGSIQRQGQTIRVTVRLIDVASGKALWAGTFDEQYRDIFSVQDAISARVAEALRLQIRNSESLSGGGTRDAEAYRLYLQARFFQFKSTPQEIRQAISFYREAIRIDRNYALAYAGLADAFRTLPITSDVGPSTAFPESKAAALKALQLEDNLAQAHTALGYVASWYEWDWKTAETEMRRGVDLDADSPEAHRGLSILFTVLGRHQEALDEMKVSRQLDPLSLPTNALEAQALHYAGRDAEAIDRLNKAFEVEPNFWIARLMLGRIYIGQSRFDDALVELDRARTASGGNSETTSLIGYVYAKKGNRELALKAIDELRGRSTDSYSPAYNIAMVYNALGETDKALAALEDAVERRDVRLILLNIDHKWDNLRQHPRFVGILRRLKLSS
jgi:serine/threonine-protein kinase